jgi:lactoylglutathione lyase
MIGLWGPGTVRGPVSDAAKHHVAFAVLFDELLKAMQRLRQNGIEILGLDGSQIDQPGVIGWMPSAQIYFRDPDGHMLEFISILPGEPRPEFVGTYSEWQSLKR